MLKSESVQLHQQPGGDFHGRVVAALSGLSVGSTVTEKRNNSLIVNV